MKLKSAMLKTNADYIILCAAVGPHFFNDGGPIGGNPDPSRCAARAGARAPGAPRLLGVRRHSRSLRPRQHALEHGIAFDEPMVERARDMEREDHTDQNPADEMPDVNAV